MTVQQPYEAAVRHRTRIADKALHLRPDAGVAAAPLRLCRHAAEEDRRNDALVAAVPKRVMSTQLQYPTSCTGFVAIQGSWERACFAEGDQEPQGQQSGLGGRAALKVVTERDIAGSFRRLKVKAEVAKALGKQQILPPTGPDDARQQGRQSSFVEAIAPIGTCLGAATKNIGIGFGRPKGPGVRNAQARRFERGEAPSFRTSGWLDAMRRASSHCKRFRRGPAISWIAPQPLPGDQRPVGAQQGPVGLRIPPVGQVLKLSPHPKRKAETSLLTHSPIWGNCVVEGDQRVPEAAGDELRAADDVIGCPRPFHILMGGLDADAEDGGDLPIGLSRRQQAHALALAAAQMRATRRRGIIVDPPGRAKAMCTDRFGAKQPLRGKIDPVADGERAGPARLPGYVDRHGETVADAEPPAPRQQLPPARRDGDQLRQLMPGEADIGPNAGMMNGVGADQAVRRKLLLPSAGIGVDPDEPAFRRSKAGMMKEGEIIEPELPCRVPQHLAQLGIGPAEAGPRLEAVDQPRARHCPVLRAALRSFRRPLPAGIRRGTRLLLNNPQITGGYGRQATGAGLGSASMRR